MRGKTLKVQDEFEEIATRTIDDRNRLTLGELPKGLKRVRIYKNGRGKFSCDLSLKSQPRRPGSFEMRRLLKASKRD